MHLTEMGIAQTGNNGNLTDETLYGQFVFCQFRAHYFQSDEFSARQIYAFVDKTHRPFSDAFNQFVAIIQNMLARRLGSGLRSLA